MSSGIRLSRRWLLRAGGVAAIDVALTRRTAVAAGTLIDMPLTPAPGRVPLVGGNYPETDVWCYDGKLPGPEIRLRQGDRLHVAVENRLGQDTTIHWHGVRVPNAMDGVPYVTQPPIEPEGRFDYTFTVPDAGTYWYHPHAHSSEQIGRGLYGPLIIEEHAAPAVDRDLTWVLGDFRLEPDASIAGGFDNPMEMSMAGRIGNTVTINGRVPHGFPVRAGERIRLRLINAAAARIYGLEFRAHRPIIIAYDGQPVEPHAPAGGRVIIAPAQRTDLVLDMDGEPSSTASVIDSFYGRLSYELVEIAYSQAPPLRKQPLAPPVQVPRNTQPEPALASAQRHQVTLTGGMMGGMMGGRGMVRGMMEGGGMMGGMMGNGGMMGRMMGNGGMMGGRRGGKMMRGAMWAINGVSVMDDDMEHMKPILTLARGRTYILAIDNRTAWYHPIHLHGHSFRVITRNGRPTRYREWRDTVLMPPRERAEIAFVADNPGDWMFHCHILDHQDGGMMAMLRVA